ncbi:hypothetical protein ABB37_05643 [Leptomonas pyrrhocoris]|uniref:Uncharacterized protein n=1 Tax=Leptomonas pyrrhocoris TaxID=157538 RepID=A0A0N1J4P8_LEPPY|nr:hypothetical protein ABB37_05643 [Leptomonas pyrrhocoris]KPA79132.1 hypothetical protein ABB37_05643 [Leptomonas pyrrhocoris]|eukprot:XP_015657571.1 hypothetical protein ABB37_05643 [Leptomonas pyrrhocoris]
MFASSPPSSAWRNHVQDQEEDLVRELMEADDVDAVLARMEGDHFRHLSPVMRKLSSFDGPKQQQPPPSPSAQASLAQSSTASTRAGQRHPPPPPPQEGPDARPYSGGRRGSDNAESRDGKGATSSLGHQPSYGRYPSSYHPPSASSSTYRGGPYGSDAPAATGDVGDHSPAARPPPPLPPTNRDYDPLRAYRRPATDAVDAAPARPREAIDSQTESRYSATMDSWLKPRRQLPLDITADSPASTTQRTDPFAATRLPTYAALETAPLVPEGNVPPPPPTPGSPWTSSGGRYHGGNNNGDPQRAPRVTTTTTTALAPPRPSGSRGRTDELGELENASQSRIARQLQLLRNYRELAELCSATKDPSVDLFRSLPSEELARMQVGQLQGLPQREQSPITVNNNYYFDNSASRRGSGGGGGGRSSRESPRRSGRGRINSVDTVGALSKTGAAPRRGGNNSPSGSEPLTVDSRPGLTSHQPSGASSSQPLRPPLLPSPRYGPLQSPQPSSAPDSPVATPPLSQRGTGGGSPAGPPPPPLLAPPSPSRSYHARSHRSRHYDGHYTPTATTEEAGSSYEEDEEEEEDYAGDFIDNDDGPDGGEDEDDATAPRPPPPRIIEREQHRRFPNNNGNGDYSTTNAQPPLSPTSQQQQQSQLPNSQHQPLLPQQQQQQQHGSYPSDYTSNPSRMNGSETFAGVDGNSFPPHVRSGSNVMPPGASPSNMGGVAGSDAGRRSVSSAINVLSGDNELRANAQLSASGMVDSRRGSLSQPPQQTQQQRHITAYNGNNFVPLAPFARNQQQQQQHPLRRSLSAGSSPLNRQRDGDAYTDPGITAFSHLNPLRDPRRDTMPSAVNRSGGRRGGNSTPEKMFSATSNSSSRGRFGSQHPTGKGKSSRSNNKGNSNTLRPGNRRDGKGRDHDRDDRRSDENSDYMDDDVGLGSNDRDSSMSGDDTPGNPQLQTHNPRSSTMRKKSRQQQQQQQQQQRRQSQRGNNVNARPGRTPANASGGRGPQRDGWDDDGTVHTPRTRRPATRQKAGSRNPRAYRQQNPSPTSSQQQRHGRHDRGRKEPSSPFYDDDGAELNSASTYSYSYATSSDINDYIAGSYYSPIKGIPSERGRGMPNNIYPGGGRSPMRGRGRGNAYAANSPYRTTPQRRPGANPAGGSNLPYSNNNSPLQGRGRGGARGVGRGRGGLINPNVLNSNGANVAAGGAPYPFYSSAVPIGRGRGAPVVIGGLQSANRRAPPPQGGGPYNNSNSNIPNSDGAQTPRRTGADPAMAPAASAPSGLVHLPNGLAVPANSPAGRQYRQMQQQAQQAQQPQPFGYPPASGLYPAGAGITNRPPQQPQMSAATSPSRAGRAASPSIVPSNINAGRSTSPGAGSAVRVHPGLLYGSLLPKARPKTALVVEDDDRGRERSVDPHGDATHEPFLEPGSVCPVQPVVPTAAPPRTVFKPSPMDTFLLTGAISGATADGVQPLAWKSGGAGCVVGRFGHLPHAPTAKLSSHYKTPNAQPLQSGAASSVGGGAGFFPSNVPPQQQQQHFNPARQPAAARKASAYSLPSAISSQAQQRATAGTNSSQQRYVPLQEPLEPARGSSGVNYDTARSPRVVDPYTPRGRAAAERSANVQRFGIAPVQN